MKKIVLILVVLAFAAFAAVDPPTHVLVKYDNNYAQLANIKTALDGLAWPYTAHVGTTYPAFWTALNDGTAWDFVIISGTYNGDSGAATNYPQLTAYATAHPNCRTMCFTWQLYTLPTAFLTYHDISSYSDIMNPTVPVAYQWDTASPVFAGQPAAPVFANPGLNRVGQKLGWVSAKATTDVPLGFDNPATTANVGAWVFSHKSGAATWQRPRSAYLGFDMSMCPANGAAFYTNILNYMWNEENPAVKVAPTSLGNIKATYR